MSFLKISKPSWLKLISRKNMLKDGTQLMNISLPDNTLVVLIKRGKNYIVPTGKTALEINDKMLVITDNQATLEETYKSLNLAGY